MQKIKIINPKTGNLKCRLTWFLDEGISGVYGDIALLSYSLDVPNTRLSASILFLRSYKSSSSESVGML